MMKKLPFIALVAVVLSGCATTKSITPHYVNPSMYQSYECAMLHSEIERVSQLAEDTKKQNTPLSTGIGIGIAGGRGGIYPTISVGTGVGSGQRQAKINTLARLYGEHDAMVIAGRQKGCAFVKGIKIYNE